MLPEVSVCVITYNQEKFIRQCLEGILMQQTDFTYEVIIGEDCSTDGTKNIIEAFEKKYPGIIKPIYHKVNVGGARNAYEFCYPLLKGKYIALCEGDDYWTDPLKLQKQVNFLRQHPDCSMCYHRANQVNEKDEILQTEKSDDSIQFFTGKQLFHLHIPTLSIAFRNYEVVIPKDILLAKCGDAFLRGMLATRGNAARLGFVGAHYRKHPGGVYSSKSVLEQFLISLQSRKTMKRSTFFNKEQKQEIRKEFLKRKIFYMFYFLKKTELRNCLRIARS